MPSSAKSSRRCSHGGRSGLASSFGQPTLSALPLGVMMPGLGRHCQVSRCWSAPLAPQKASLKRPSRSELARLLAVVCRDRPAACPGRKPPECGCRAGVRERNASQRCPLPPASPTRPTSAANFEPCRDSAPSVCYNPPTSPRQRSNPCRTMMCLYLAPGRRLCRRHTRRTTGVESSRRRQGTAGGCVPERWLHPLQGIAKEC